jgi:hypothetical protein
MKTAILRALVPHAVALTLLSCASFGAAGLGQAWRPPRPVSITSESSEMKWIDLVPSGLTCLTGTSESSQSWLLVSDGDLVTGTSSASDSSFIYRQSDGTSLDMRAEDGRLLLSRKTVSIAPADIDACWEWLDHASAKELRSLRFLTLPGKTDESRLQILRRLAAANPNLNLGVEPISSSMPDAALFKPRLVYVEGTATTAELGGLLAGQEQIETLYLNVSKAENLDFLRMLPNLRRLVIIDCHGPLPAGLRGLKSLVLLNADLAGMYGYTQTVSEFDVSALAAVPEGIEELSLVGYQIASMGGLERLTGLRTLILNRSRGIEDLSALRGLKKLAWVGLPLEITQEGFSTFIGEHPAIQFIELMGCGGITDLSPLRRLSGLKGLAVGPKGTGQDPEDSVSVDQVVQLKSLEFLGLPLEVEGDLARFARIREALPHAIVVPAACLGSGWILLVVPLAALMGIAGSWARRGAAPRRTAQTRDEYPAPGLGRAGGTRSEAPASASRQGGEKP